MKTSYDDGKKHRIQIIETETGNKYVADIRYHEDTDYNPNNAINIDIFNYVGKNGIETLHLVDVPVFKFNSEFTIVDNKGGRKSRKSKSRIRRKSNKNRKTRRRRRCGRR
jgi:hypothetical protein